MKYKITTEPLTEPITLEEAKLNLRVTSTAEDDLISSLITTAREWCEAYERRLYGTQEVTVKYDGFCRKIKLPIGPAISVTSIKYIDTNGEEQTLSSSNYILDDYSTPPVIIPTYSFSWPSARDDYNVLTVVYQAGYVDAPERVKTAIRLVVNHLYEHREQNIEVSLNSLPLGVKSLLCERSF